MLGYRGVHISFRRFQKIISKQQALVYTRKASGAGTPSNWKTERQLDEYYKRTMDHYPGPAGEFHNVQGRRIRTMNKQLLASVLFFGFTGYMMWRNGALYLHSAPPTRVDDEKSVTDSSVRDTSLDEEPAPKLALVEVPDKAQYLIIGAGTSGFAAYRAIKATDPKAKVIMIGEEPYAPYMRPPLSKELWFSDKELRDDLRFKQWSGRTRSLFFEHESFYTDPKKLQESENGGIALILGRKVKQLKPEHRQAILEDGKEIIYDKCLIATGGKPKQLACLKDAEAELKRRTTLFRTVGDYKRLDRIASGSSSVCVVGGGFLGSEIACALAGDGTKPELEVTQLIPECGNMAHVLPKYLSKWTTDRVREEGVNVRANTSVKSARLDGDKVVLSLSDGSEHRCDHVVVAVGLEPNTALAASSGLEVHEQLGGILVNSELQARSNVWVAGDVACFYDEQLGRRRVEHHDHAVISGRLAGENMAGAAKPYTHQSMFWSDLGSSVGFEAIGLVDARLPTVAVFAKATDEDSPRSSAPDDRTDSTTESIAPTTGVCPVSLPSEDYGKGVVFYTRNDIIVGILLWNIFNKMTVARKILKEGMKDPDFNEVAKLFDFYGKHYESEQ